MRNPWFSIWQGLRRCLVLAVCLIICFSVFLPGKFAQASYAATWESRAASADCAASASPTPQSLLVVLLDRSGSLIEGPQATDPQGYSTSVTKALADLWTGQMAVIPFRGDTKSLPILGPEPVAGRSKLKTQIQATAATIGGDTPLAPAMQEALQLIQHNGNPAGSQVIIITDGNPTGISTEAGTGPAQEQEIRSTFISQFCQSGIPISAFGLEINTSTPDGQDANKLLTDITSGTDGAYKDVTSPEQLSQVVIGLYAQWQHLNFIPESSQSGNYYVHINNLTQQAIIVTFRSNSSYAVTVTDPNGQQIGPPLATDQHYQIDDLSTGGALIPGNYAVNVSADPQAYVYVLVKSSVGLTLLAPTSKTIAHATQPLTIQGEFLSGTTPLTPKIGDGQMIATVTLLVNGQQVASTIVNLNQQSSSPIFSGTASFQQAGQVHIDLRGTYQETPLQTSFTLTLLPAPLPPCSFTCQLQQRLVLWISLGSGLVLLAIMLLIVLLIIRHSRRPRLEGYITNGKPPFGEVELTELRRTSITSIELETLGNFQFGGARFALHQQPTGSVIIRLLNDSNGQVALSKAGKRIEVTKQGIELDPGDKIYTDGNNQKASASYEAMSGRRW